MDPNASLKKFIDAVALCTHEGDEEAREAYHDIIVWIHNGGFEPNWPCDAYRNLFFHTAPTLE